MTKYDLEPIVKTYYDALEKGTILGRKCAECGHIEFPPYLCCNACGGLHTEWVDLTNMRGVVKQALPTKGAFGDPDFRQKHGDYFAVEIEIQGAFSFNTSLLHVDYDQYAQFDAFIKKEKVETKPLLIQDEDTKVVVWELADDDSPFKKMPDPVKERSAVNEAGETAAERGAFNETGDPVTKSRACNETGDPVAKSGDPGETAEPADGGKALPDPAEDPVAAAVFACAAEAYGVDVSALTMETDIREDLSNESMKMIVMISSIEDELEVTIEIQEAGNLNTLSDFVRKVKEKM